MTEREYQRNVQRLVQKIFVSAEGKSRSRAEMLRLSKQFLLGWSLMQLMYPVKLTDSLLVKRLMFLLKNTISLSCTLNNNILFATIYCAYCGNTQKEASA